MGVTRGSAETDDFRADSPGRCEPSALEDEERPEGMKGSEPCRGVDEPGAANGLELMGDPGK